jgi:hypothetical protein
MHGNRHWCHGLLRSAALLLISVVVVQCKVYTVNKTDLEKRLNPKGGDSEYPVATMNSISSLYQKQMKNNLDTLSCSDEIGKKKMKRINHDSKITIITKKNKAIKLYAKTLYIYKDEFLIGERTKPKLYGPNYFPIKLSEISRIEVKGY